MNIIKSHTYTTDVYRVENGPTAETAPGHLTQGMFKVDYLAVSYLNGELEKVYLKGKRLKADGEPGKTMGSRTFFGSFPHWVVDFLHTVDTA